MKIPLTDQIQPFALAGCICVNGLTVPVAVVEVNGVQHISRRKTGVLGDYLEDISKMLTADEFSFTELMKGKTVQL